MERIEDSSPGSVLYMDTDPIIFVHKQSCYRPRVANFLGEMTDEINEEFGMGSKGSKMTEFYTCEPKTYSYKVVKEFTKLKAKGVTQTVEVNEILSFELIKNKQFIMLRKNQSLPNLFLKSNLELTRNMRLQQF
jgi:hypothetical protein